MSTVALSGDISIDGVLWGVKWDDASLTYAFPTLVSDYGGYPQGAFTGLAGFTAAQKIAVHDIIASVNAVISLPITFTSDASTANLRFAEAEFVDQDGFGYPGEIFTAVGTPPDDTWSPPYGQGDMFFNRFDYNLPEKGNYAFHTLIHELGHSLGLKHGHAAQEYPGSTTLIPALPANIDSMEFSIMTYRSTVGGPVEGAYTNEEYGYAQSLMMLDIAALQYLYGADYTSNNGNSVYTWDGITGEMSINGTGQGAAGANRVFLTIWDGGGTDTYDMSNYGGGVKIDLAPGHFSVTAREQLALLDEANGTRARGNVFNSLLHDGDLRSLIENAMGGTGSDTITGNVGVNTLRGGAGNDTIIGGGSRDLLFGDASIDTISGGTGSDRITGGRGADTMTGGAGSDRYIFKTQLEGGDTITDFSSTATGNDDSFWFAGTAFGFATTGQMDANLLECNDAGAATTELTRFVYDGDDEILLYDQDGSGTAAAIIMAKLQDGAVVTAGDFFIY